MTPHRKRALAVLALAIVLRLGLIVVWYTPGLFRFEHGDYILYRIGAEHFQAEHDFANSLFLVRPPLLSLVIYAFNSNHLAVLVFNAMVGALAAPLTCALAFQFRLSARTITAAGILAAVDPAGVFYSSFLGAEALANTFLLVCICALVAMVQASNERHRFIWAVIAAVGLIFSSYARPSTHTLWILLTLWLWVAYRRYWRPILAFAALSLIGVGVWIGHNGIVFGNATFSTVGPFTMLYYRAASIERIASGDDIDTVYERINRRVEDLLPGEPDYPIDAGTRQRYLAATPEVQNALQAVALEIFLAHPLVYLATVPVGLGRLYGLLPDAVNLLPSTQGALSVGLQVACNWLMLLGVLVGLVLALRRRQWLMFWCVLLVSAYYTVGTLLVKSAGLNVRERSMLTPFIALTVAYAISGLTKTVRHRP